MKTERFERRGSIWIERRVNREGPLITYTVWKPHTARAFCDEQRKEMLKFIAWPASTPTGAEIREWLKSFDEPEKPVLELQQQPLPKPEQQAVVITPGSWDPIAEEEEPNDETKMVT